MNWNSHEFIWLDWLIIAVGILAVTWAVWRSVQKDKRLQQGANSEDYLFGKGEPWYIIGAAIFAANIGSEHLVGLAGTGAKAGVGMAHWEMQGWMILLLGWLFVPFYQLMNNKMGKIITMPDACYRFVVVYYHAYSICIDQSERNSLYRRYFYGESFGFAFLVRSNRFDSLNGYIYGFGRNERCNDPVGNSNTYTYHWLVSRAFLGIICIGIRKYCRRLDCND